MWLKQNVVSNQQIELLSLSILFFILIKLDPSKHLHFNLIEDRNSLASLLTYRLEKIEVLVAWNDLDFRDLVSRFLDHLAFCLWKIICNSLITNDETLWFTSGIIYSHSIYIIQRVGFIYILFHQ